jgi:hypothetical protein
MPDAVAVHLFETECERHHVNTLQALRDLKLQVDRALENWETSPFTQTSSYLRNAGAPLAEASAEAAAYLALRDVRFLAKGEPSTKEQ